MRFIAGLVAAGLMAACEVTEPDERLVLGTIAFISDTAGITLPQNVRTNEPFPVSFYTIGYDCHEFGQTEVVIQGNVIDIMPYDIEKNQACSAQQQTFEHTVWPTLSMAGPARVRITGLKLPDHNIVTLERTVTVHDRLNLSVERDAAAALQTDSLHLTWRRLPNVGWEVWVAFVYTNTTADTVYVPHCHFLFDMTLEKQVGSGWVPFWRSSPPACASPPLVMAPGQSLRNGIWLTGGDADHSLHPKFASAEMEGIYRLVWHQPHHSSDTLAVTQRTSNRFGLEVEYN